MNSQRGKASTNASKNVNTSVTKSNARGNGKRRTNNRQRKRNGNNNFNSSDFQKQSSVGAAYSTTMKQSGPTINRVSLNSTRIKHRELIGNIIGDSVYTIKGAYALNPGQFGSFPWLAGQAAGWEKYRFNSLKFHLLTRCGTSVPGSLMMFPDYDAADTAPGSEFLASSYSGFIEGAPWKDLSCSLDPQMMGGIKFIRTGALPASTDIKTYDCGNMFIAVTDGTAVNWSKSYVEYDVTLFNPTNSPVGPAEVGTLFGNTSCDSTHPFGLEQDIVTTGDLIIAVDSANNLKIFANNCTPSVEYAVTISIIGTVISAFDLSTTGATTQTYYTSIKSGALLGLMYYTFIATSSQPVLTLAITATTVTSCRADWHTIPLGTGF